jgi:RNA polymerase sigma-70 factor (ECF subfamily)
MATRQLSRAIEGVRRAALLRKGASLSDGQLLGRFVERHDEAAFEALVRRHGPMVLGVCGRVLGHHQDAEDAFQATFLVLAKKAASVKPRELVGNFLYGVACHVARKARALADRRKAREKQVMDMPESEAASNGEWTDLRPLLDQELGRLPAKYRGPIVLCDLEGKARKDVARQLGWPEGTLSGRLARGRALLAKRLARQGLALSGGPWRWCSRRTRCRAVCRPRWSARRSRPRPWLRRGTRRRWARSPPTPPC